MLGDFGKDLTSIVTMLIGVALVALLVGHASGAGYLIQQGSTGLNTLLNTVELTNTATNGPNSSQMNGPQGATFSNNGGGLGYSSGFNVLGNSGLGG